MLWALCYKKGGVIFLKNFIIGAMVFIALLIVASGVVALGGWLISCLLNVGLVQIGLGEISTWGAICLMVACSIIYKFITWK